MRSRNAGGYTLLELMVTVAIFAVLVVITIPPVMKAVERRAVRDAAAAVSDMVEFAKVQAASRNRAYLLTVTKTGGTYGTNGLVRVWEGPSSACIGFDTSAPPLRSFVLADDYPVVHIVGTVPSDLEHPVGLCMKPDGRVVRSDTQQPIQSGNSNYVAGDARILLQRYGGSYGGNGSLQPEGPINAVVVPYHGAPRLAVQ